MDVQGQSPPEHATWLLTSACFPSGLVGGLSPPAPGKVRFSSDTRLVSCGKASALTDEYRVAQGLAGATCQHSDVAQKAILFFLVYFSGVELGGG